MKQTRHFSRGTLALALAAALAACGGGGGGSSYFPAFPVGSAPPDTGNGNGGGGGGGGNGGGVPPVQVSAYDAFVAYVVALVATKLDQAEPANVAQFDPPPTSETADPVATP